MTPPLQRLKAVVTMPPHGWFGGVDYNFAVEMADEIEELGARVFRLDVASLITRNDVYVKSAIDALRGFAPDVAVSLPNALYVLLCKTLDDRNIFRDVLKIPTLMLWDHGLLQLPRQILQHLPSTPAKSAGGAVRRIRKALNHPLFLHYSPDRGHIEALDRFGVVEASKVRFFLQPAYPNFVRHGYRTPASNAFRTPLAFAGNVYLKAAESLPFRSQPVLGDIEKRVLAAKRASLTECLWDLLMGEIDRLDRPTRKQLRLDPSQTFFWNYMHEEIEMAGNTDVRLHVLTGLDREYEFYGNFVEPAAVSTLRDRYRIRFRKCLDYFTELPLLFMNSDLIVDVINLGYNSGISPKVMGCFACGGMVLFDYKEDFARTMGEAGEQVMYRSVEHLNAMVEDYLSNPRKRRDVARYLQHRVATEFSFGALAKRLLVDEPAWKS
jgi:hypothetical protein